MRTSAGDLPVRVPRDHASAFQPALLEKYQTSTNELEEQIIALYAKGVSTRDIHEKATTYLPGCSLRAGNLLM